MAAAAGAVDGYKAVDFQFRRLPACSRVRQRARKERLYFATFIAPASAQKNLSP